MDEQRIQAYLSLIQELFTCPGGEEGRILREHSDLMDEGFFRVGAQVAEQLQEAGQEQQALFLMGLLAQVIDSESPTSSSETQIPEESGVLDTAATFPDGFPRNPQEAVTVSEALSPTEKEEWYEWLQTATPEQKAELVDILHSMWQQSQASADVIGSESPTSSSEPRILQESGVLGSTATPQERFLQEVLEAVSDSDVNPRVVYPLLANNLDKLNTAFIETIQIFVQNNGTQNTVIDLFNFGNLIQQFPLGQRDLNLEIAITIYNIALDFFPKATSATAWAAIQNNLGNAYSNRIRGDRAENIEKAIAAYEQALQVYTREAFPEDWAMTQNNLGIAYSDRITGERAENLEYAIAAYEQALQVRTREAFPEKWAGTQNNLGTAYWNRITGERAENLEYAIAAYEQALLEYTREAFPEKWATTQNNLGAAYQSRIRGDRAENLENAIAAYEQALLEYTRQAFPEDWAMTQNNLGAAYQSRIRGERAYNLEYAIAAYEQALQVRTRQAFPEDWAMTQNNLGAAYQSRIRGERAYNLEYAIAAYEQALLEYTREAFPEDWAMTQENLAYAYIDLKDNNKAIQYLKAALEVFTPATLPLSCLKAGRNLGNLAYDLEAWETACFGYDNAIRAVEQSRNWATSPQSKQKILADALPLYGKMVEACLHLERYDQALLTIERSKSRTLIELLNQADLVPKNATPTQQQRYRQLSREITALQQAFEGEAFLNDLTEDGENRHSPQTPAPPQNNLLQALLSQREALLTEINDPDFNELISVSPQLPDFSQLLTPITALIEWYLPPDPDLGAYAFVVTLTDNQPHIQLHPYTASQRQALDAFNQAYFADFRQDSWYNTLAARLRDLAQILDLASLIELLPQPCHSLILIPHLYLHLFPLHALPITVDHKTLPWQETVATGIRYAPSSQILDYIHNRPQNTTAKQFFAIQNPTEDLPYTDLEIEVIRRNFDPNSYILSRTAATKAALNAAENLAQLRQSRLIHFACHGGFNSENPLDSALILAGDMASPPQEGRTLTLRDGRRFDTTHQGLTLREIYANLELRACRLVILSACETGLLSSQLTDEYIGLASGFLYAGSPSVISSLWCVDDFATAFLTIRFYQEFTPNTPIAQAAKAAQAWMRQVSQADFLKWLQDDLELPQKAFRNCQLRLRRRYKTHPPFSDPKYWSAFAAIGL